jgi:hypothetical protein
MASHFLVSLASDTQRLFFLYNCSTTKNGNCKVILFRASKKELSRVQFVPCVNVLSDYLSPIKVRSQPVCPSVIDSGPKVRKTYEKNKKKLKGLKCKNQRMRETDS